MKKVWYVLVGLLILSSLLQVEGLKVEVTQEKIPPAPQVVFLYPEGLQNGSSFLPGDYIYFTLSGNLSLINTPTSRDYYVRYHWEGENYGEGDWIDSIWNASRPIEPRWHTSTLYDGIAFITPLQTGLTRWDVWHNLTFEIYYDESIISVNTYQFYANSSLAVGEPLSVTPINYPNNSFIPHTLGEYESYLVYQANGYILDQKTFTTNRELPYAKQLNISYSWDNINWNIASFFYGYNPDPFNIFYVRFDDNNLEDNVALWIKLQNVTSSKIFRYNYSFFEPFSFIRNNWYVWSYDFYWRMGESKPLCVENTDSNVTYNWYDGTGNHTILSSQWIAGFHGWNGHYNLTVPNLGSEKSGPSYVSFWFNNGREYRYSFIFESIDPQIKLIYPVNDMAKSGMIPIVWSLETLSGGFIDYSQYKFDLYFETDTINKTSVVSNYNPITSIDLFNENGARYTKINQPAHQLFLSIFNYYRMGIDPMALGYEFDASILFNQGGTGSSIAEENSTEVRFIIEETTTNTTYNSSLGINMKVSGSGIEPIKSATSEWITVYYSPPSVITPEPTSVSSTSTKTTTEPEDTDPPIFIDTPPDITIYQSPFSLVGFIIGILVFFKKVKLREK